MDQARAQDTLTRSFRALPEEHRENLRWHVERGTPVLCGEAKAAYAWVLQGKP